VAIHIRTAVELDLARVREDLLRLGSLAELEIDWAMQALRSRNHSQARRVLENEALAGNLRVKIERAAMQLVATHHPAARDLRALVAAMHIAGELNRIVGHAGGIANISLRIGDEGAALDATGLYRMHALVSRMVHVSIDAYFREDAALARITLSQDADVDALHAENWQCITAPGPLQIRDIERLTHLLWVTHNLERIGDRVQNICERVMFIVTGEFVET
jgi:phosphate transport system protein